MDDDTATEILESTYRALCKHGYADLTVENIADEAERSKASIHYYYDSKENLFIEFLDFLYDRYTAKLPAADGGTPREQLSALLEIVLTEEEAAPGQEFRTALLEVKAQAPYSDAIQTRLVSLDQVLFERVRDIIAAGVETGEFDAAVEPTVAAEFLVTVIKGAHTRRVAVDHSSERLHETVIWYVDSHLIGDDLSGATP
ncbi:TetR/AcrR family transcriptional regulator [Halomicroarcula limicola]|uniref:TetR/AcrR family transcriptional regulator n=1 Tax=Haloarcula limicola TaxID=1429915 RepID=A0A8J7Y7H7_9EURY|nr:TetR/AcrR family transcriptional regulator [Halomicroarcula limicola]MBV0926000.1 TetR/AcrR family transcriptional regulator [Halomicroarcula limicola]